MKHEKYKFTKLLSVFASDREKEKDDDESPTLPKLVQKRNPSFRTFRNEFKTQPAPSPKHRQVRKLTKSKGHN